MLKLIWKYKVYYSIIFGALLGFFAERIMTDTFSNTMSYLLIFILCILLINRSMVNEMIKNKRESNYIENNPISKYNGIFSIIKNKVFK